MGIAGSERPLRAGWSARVTATASSHWASCAGRGSQAALAGVAGVGPFLILLFFSPREKLEEKAKLYEKMTEGDFIGKYSNLFILLYFL